MLLLDEKRWITHMSVLVIGDVHCGKSQLIHTFVTRTQPQPQLGSRSSNPNLCIQSSKSDTPKPSLVPISPPAATTSPAQPPSLESDVYLSNYCPTIEDGHTFQFILPPNPSYTAPYNPPPPPPPSAHVPRDPILLLNGEVNSDTTKSNVADQEERAKQNRQRVVLHIIDAGGDPAFSQLWPSMIEAADAFMLVYDVGNRASFEKVWGFFKLIVETRCQLPKEVPMLLVGSMVDTVGETASKRRHREVTLEMGAKLASTLGVPFKETTAKALRSVGHCFRAIVEEAQARVHEDVAESPEVNAGRTAEDSTTSPAIQPGTQNGTTPGRTRWASANPLGGGFIKKWQNRRPSDSSVASLSSILTGSSVSMSSSSAGGAISPNLGSSSTSGSASPIASSAGFRFSAGSRRSLGSVERTTESSDGGGKTRDSVMSAETTGDVVDMINNLSGFGDGRVSRTSSGVSLASGQSFSGEGAGKQQQDGEGTGKAKVQSNSRPARLDSTRYKRDVAYAAWKALQASRRNSISSITSNQSSRRGRSFSLSQVHNRRISRGSVAVSLEPPPVPPRRGQSVSALYRSSVMSNASHDVAPAAEPTSRRSSHHGEETPHRMTNPSDPSTSAAPHTPSRSSVISKPLPPSPPSNAPNTPDPRMNAVGSVERFQLASTATTPRSTPMKRVDPTDSKCTPMRPTSVASSVATSATSSSRNRRHLPVRSDSLINGLRASQSRSFEAGGLASPTPSSPLALSSVGSVKQEASSRPSSPFSSPRGGTPERAATVDRGEFFTPSVGSARLRSPTSLIKVGKNTVTVREIVDLEKGRRGTDEIGSREDAASARRHRSMDCGDRVAEMKGLYGGASSVVKHRSAEPIMQTSAAVTPSRTILKEAPMTSEEVSPPRRAVDLGERGAASPLRRSQTITASSVQRGRAASAPSPAAMKPRSRSTSVSKREAASRESTAGGPSLDQVRRNLQEMMEALEAYQFGEEGSLTPPQTSPGGEMGSMPALSFGGSSERGQRGSWGSSGSSSSPGRVGLLGRSRSMERSDFSPARDGGATTGGGGSASASKGWRSSGGSGGLVRDGSPSSSSSGRFFSKGSMGRVGVLGRIRSGSSVPASNSSVNPPTISISSPTHHPSESSTEPSLDTAVSDDLNSRSSRPLFPTSTLPTSHSSPLPLSSYLSEQAGMTTAPTTTSTGVGVTLMSSFQNYGSWRPVESRRVGNRKVEEAERWEIRQPWDDDLELLQEMDDLESLDGDGGDEMDGLDVEGEGREDGEGGNASEVVGLYDGVSSGTASPAGVGSPTRSGVGDESGALSLGRGSKSSMKSPTKRVAALIPKDELADPLVSKRGSNYFPTPGMFVPSTPLRSGSGNTAETPDARRQRGDAETPSTPASFDERRSIEDETEIDVANAVLNFEADGNRGDEGLGGTTITTTATGTIVRRSRLEKLREVMEGLDEREVMEVVKEYIARSAMAAAAAEPAGRDA
ncbi:hypothetical protein HDU67_005538 [Dinochytrium kinnereticum]|nr:hypothetical protein HDU67_005538 [Dinochytrium kinnereticum]